MPDDPAQSPDLGLLTARAAHERAGRTIVRLKCRIDHGDSTVSGAELVAAETDVVITRRLLDHARRAVTR